MLVLFLWLAGAVDTEEGFAVWVAVLTAHLLGHAAHHLLRSGHFGHLRGVVAQGGQLGIDGFGDVNTKVVRIEVKQQQGAHFVGLEAFFEEFGEGKMVAGQGKDGIDGGLARGAVVGVVNKTVLHREHHGGVEGNDRIWLTRANTADDVALEGLAHFQGAVFVR